MKVIRQFSTTQVLGMGLILQLCLSLGSLNTVSSCSSKSATPKLLPTTTTSKPVYQNGNLQQGGVWKPVVAHEEGEQEQEGDHVSMSSSSTGNIKKHQNQQQQQPSSVSPANGHNEELLLLKSVPTITTGKTTTTTEISQRRLGGSETQVVDDDDDDEMNSSSLQLPSSSSSHHFDANSHSILQNQQLQIQQNHHNHQFTKSHKPLTLVQFANKSVQCNDKTTAGYYVRNSPVRNSNSWIIFLEGGWFCFDERSCQNRWLRLKNLMSSSGWLYHKHVGGILSPDPNENPYWWNANHVFVPYCSSDTWSGTSSGEENGSKFSFMGALIIDEVIKTLIRSGGVRADSTVILAGSSAGGTGVLINLDRVEALMNKKFGLPSPSDDSGLAPPRVRGISDSGWFIDKLPSYSEKVDCQDVILCPPNISLKKGMSLWNARLPESCQNSYPNEPWSCFFGYKIYPTLKGSLFVFQWMFDEAQMLVNNVPTPALKKEEWDYVYKVGDELKKTLINVTNVFIPACMAHTVLTHRDWKRVEVNSVYLPRALKCWESGGTVGESNSIQSRQSWDDDVDDNADEESSLSHINLNMNRRNPRLGNRISLQHSPPTEPSDFSDVNSNDSRRNRRRHNRHRQRQQQATKRERRKHRKKLEQERAAAAAAAASKSQTRTNKRRNVQLITDPPHRIRQRQRRRHNNDKLPSSDEPGSGGNSNNHINALRSSNSNGRVATRNSNSNNQNSNSDDANNSNNFTNNHLRNRNSKKKNRKRRWFSVCDAGESSVGSGGDIRLIESCSWPQCNRSCPKLLNPLTGEEVDFKDLLRSFGLDMTTMAKSLGIDLATLNSMDHQVLLQMLTQHA